MSLKPSYDIGELVCEAEKAARGWDFAAQYGTIDIAAKTRAAWIHGYEAGSKARDPEHGIREIKP